MGRSGCGKGTQVKLLQEYIKKIDPDREILYIQTGSVIREFIKGENYTEKAAKVLYDTGELQPEFLAVHNWTDALVKNYKGNQNIIIDGTPRKFHEAGVLNSVFSFYNLPKPFILDIEISSEESMRRLLLRKRLDDNEDAIKKRHMWYEKEVIPALEYYKNNPGYIFLKIDGMRPVEDVHKEIVAKIESKF